MQDKCLGGTRKAFEQVGDPRQMLPLIVIHSSRPFPELYLKHHIIGEEAHTRRQREIPQVTAPDLQQLQALRDVLDKSALYG